MPNTKKGPHSGYFWREHPLFLPESCVFAITLVCLLGVGKYEKILRPTQNPTFAGMDPLPETWATDTKASTTATYFLQNN